VATRSVRPIGRRCCNLFYTRILDRKRDEGGNYLT
jgi:hypothetical protein